MGSGFTTSEGTLGDLNELSLALNYSLNSVAKLLGNFTSDVYWS